MGKPTGFLEVGQKKANYRDCELRLKDYNEFVVDLSEEELRTQASRCMDCGIPYCHSGIRIKRDFIGCSLANLIPEFNDMVYRGQWEEAYKRLSITSNFPEYTARVCPALCEGSCMLGLNMKSVTIKQIEKAIIEKAFEKGWVTPKKTKNNGLKACVIGSGPAGMVAADDLNVLGYDVTIYEKSDKFGGLLMYGIPNMKLEKRILDRRIDILKQEGIHFIANTNVGTDITVEEIKKQYDVIVLACGTEIARDLRVENRDVKGVHFALEYLTGVTKNLYNKEISCINVKDKNVIVIGGGDTGNDCVGTAVRQGCKSVKQFEIMPKPSLERTSSNPWPLFPRLLKTDYGQEEAKYVFGEDPRVYEVSTTKFIGEETLTGLETVKVTFENGSFVEVPNTKTVWDADYVFLALGFVGANKGLYKQFGITDVSDYQTNIDNIYVCGDMKMGQSLVVTAMDDAKKMVRYIKNK